MIPKLKVQTWKSGLNSTKVVILNNGTVNTIDQKPGYTKSYYSLEWIKDQEKNDQRQSQANFHAVDTKTVI